jgi:hypothetical protein
MDPKACSLLWSKDDLKALLDVKYKGIVEGKWNQLNQWSKMKLDGVKLD